MILATISSSGIVDIISTVGFPIACVVALGWYVKELDKEHKQEVDSLAEQIAKMNVLIEKIIDRIDLVFKEDKNNEDK
jgi:hypothetical protein